MLSNNAKVSHFASPLNWSHEMHIETLAQKIERAGRGLCLSTCIPHRCRCAAKVIELVSLWVGQGHDVGDKRSQRFWLFFAVAYGYLRGDDGEGPGNANPELPPNDPLMLDIPQEWCERITESLHSAMPHARGFAEEFLGSALAEFIGAGEREETRQQSSKALRSRKHRRQSTYESLKVYAEL